MSDFGEALFDLLPMHCSLQSPNNPGRKVLDNSIGEWFDHHDVLTFYDNLFLDTATGVYLDLFGKDYGVTRQVDESDEDYRVRIIQEKNDHLTPAYLKDLYGLDLYQYVPAFDIEENMLTSDNPYGADHFIAIIDEDIKKILDKKFILDNYIFWYDGTILDYIITTSNTDIITDYQWVYDKYAILTDLFKNDTTIKKVKLTLPNAEFISGLLQGCTGLTDVTLDITKNAFANNLCKDCSNLVNMNISIPNIFPPTEKLNGSLISSSTSLKKVILNVHPTIKSAMISKFSNTTNFPNVEVLVVNGEEVDLS